MQDLIDFIKDIKLINQMRHKIQKKKIHWVTLDRINYRDQRAVYF